MTVPGRLSSLYVNGHRVGGVVDMTVNLERDHFDRTDSDGLIRGYVAGEESMTIGATMVYDGTDEAQAELLASLFPSPRTVRVGFELEDAAGVHRLTGEGFVTALSQGMELNQMSVSIRSTVDRSRPVVDEAPRVEETAPEDVIDRSPDMVATTDESRAWTFSVDRDPAPCGWCGELSWSRYKQYPYHMRCLNQQQFEDDLYRDRDPRCRWHWASSVTPFGPRKENRHDRRRRGC